MPSSFFLIPISCSPQPKQSHNKELLGTNWESIRSANAYYALLCEAPLIPNVPDLGDVFDVLPNDIEIGKLTQ